MTPWQVRLMRENDAEFLPTVDDLGKRRPQVEQASCRNTTSYGYNFAPKHNYNFLPGMLAFSCDYRVCLEVR